jgi:hypothetical protein
MMTSDITKPLKYASPSVVTCHVLKLFQVCALISDLEILEDGDESEIGERGVCHFVVTILLLVF